MSDRSTIEELEHKVLQLEAELDQCRAELSDVHSSRRRYQTLFNNLLYEVHIWEVIRDDDGSIRTWRLVDANPAALEAWGRELPDIVGRTTDEIFPGVNATESFLPVVEKIFDDRQPHKWEQHFAGTGQTLLMISVPIGDMFISSGVDVSELKQAETRLKNALLQLRESITAGNVGLWDWELETNRTRFSKEWKAQIGYRDDEIEDDFEEWRKRVHPDDLESTLAVINNSIAMGNRNHETEFRFRHKDGSYRWILARASVIRDESGKPVQMLGSHVDITKTKLLEQTLSQSRKNEALGFLASGIAHDFNNLLAPILGYTELARKRLPENVEEQEYLRAVQESAGRAKDLVEKILIINRSSRRRREVVCLSELAGEVTTVLKASASKDIAIHLDTGSDIPPVSADSSEIYQVILNLCTNAIQAMPDGGELLICLHARQRDTGTSSRGLPDGEFVCLSVTDTGCGMDSATLAHVFDPFFTTRVKDDQRGTGLGLAIASSIIRQHGGDIEIDSEPGKGTVARICLPVGSTEQDMEEDAAEPSTGGGSARILLVDDEELLCQLNTTFLHELGYEVSSHTDGREAVEELAAKPDTFDLVITDYSMPGMSGPELIREIRKLNPSLPVIVLTGYSNLATEENLRQWACDDIITKPCGIEELGKAVRRMLVKGAGNA